MTKDASEKSMTEKISPEMTLDDLYARFLSYLDVKPKTEETYTRSLRRLLHYFSQNQIDHPRREDILSFRSSLSSLKPATVQSYITAARLFFQWTAQEGLYENIAEHVKGAKIDRAHKKDYLTSRQVRDIMGAIERKTPRGLRDYAIFAVMVTGGLRTAEVSSADVCDLGNVADHAVLFIRGKGRDEKSEYVKLHEIVERSIREYLKTRGPLDRRAPLFASTSNNGAGGRLSARSVSGIVKSSLRNAGYDSNRLTAHSLRHTAVTLSLLSGIGIEEVRQFARHQNISTTQIYSHALDLAENGCAEAVANAIFG